MITSTPKARENIPMMHNPGLYRSLGRLDSIIVVVQTFKIVSQLINLITWRTMGGIYFSSSDPELVDIAVQTKSTLRVIEGTNERKRRVDRSRHPYIRRFHVQTNNLGESRFRDSPFTGSLSLSWLNWIFTVFS